ncbi:MAG: aryl-sulfate sulfotransferase [Planctomycetes bacterium]|nr:aryl-sulfate sulfotransferase [Planctomycetota bacterium]
MLRVLAVGLCAGLSSPSAVAAAVQQQPAPGLRLYQAVGSSRPQLVDTNGNVVHTWPNGGNISSHLGPDGTLLRGQQTGGVIIAGATGRIQRHAFDGTLLWDFLVDGPLHYAHHDIEPMPNGNVLVIAWDRYTVNDAIAAGRDPALLSGSDWFPDAILEIRPNGPTGGTIVWEWHITDHLIQDFDAGKANFGVVANAPGLLDINYPPILVSDGDWNHFNGLDYDPVNDWIVVSSRSQDEIYIIDHSTTTAEAAGHTGGQRGRGGDFLWRWGNPEVYRAGSAVHHVLRGQHDPRFIAPGRPGAGNVTVFNNDYVPGQSAVHELALPVGPSGNLVLDPVTGRYGPVTPVWTFTEAGFNSLFVSSAERLPNGNTLICSGTQNRLFEVTAAGTTVWNYVDPAPSLIFQCHYVERSLWRDTGELPIGGGTVAFDHLTGSPHAGQIFVLLGSISGTAPGTLVPGGVLLPLNLDFLTSAMATNWNSGIFVNTLGLLDGDGHASSNLAVPSGLIPAALVGTDLDFAHLIYHPTTLVAVRASNPVRVQIVP